MVDSDRDFGRALIDDLPDDSRERGFLTEPDRKYLRGTSDVKPRSDRERHTRRRIRRRVQHAILDFALVFYGMAERDVRQVFSNKNAPVGSGGFGIGMDSTLAFLYLGTQDRLEKFSPHLNAAINNAVNRRSGDRRLVADVEFDVSVSDPMDIEIDDVIDKLASHREHELSEAELRTFLRWYSYTRQFDPEAVRNQIHEWREELNSTRVDNDERAGSDGE